MGILEKIFGRTDEAHRETERHALDSDAQCSHTMLAPHWDNPEDMGNKELATYTCEACGEKFSAAEAGELMDQPPPALANAQRGPGPYDHDKS